MSTFKQLPNDLETSPRMGGRRTIDDFFHLLIEVMDEGVVVTDCNRNILYINDKFCEITGYSFENLLDQDIKSFLDPQNQAILLAELANCQKETSSTFEINWTNERRRETLTLASLRLIENKSPINNFVRMILAVRYHQPFGI